MEYTGLLWGYKLNRELSDQERTNQLKVSDRLNFDPIDQLSVIRKNSTFIEVVDKFYAFRGIALIFMLFAIAGTATFLMLFIALAIQHPAENQRTTQLAFTFFVILLLTPLMILSIRFALKESFTYTHWPVRMNRENRMVYVFRHNGEGGVLEVPWDDVFFTIGISKGQFMGIHNCYLCGHVIDSQGLIQDTFAFGYVSTDRDIQTRVLPHWEYIRRYMADGENAVPEPQAYLPIAEKRETIAFSFLKALQQYAYNWLTVIIFSPLALVAGIGRIVAMKTSRIPRWPEYVRKACGDD